MGLEKMGLFEASWSSAKMEIYCDVVDAVAS